MDVAVLRRSNVDPPKLILGRDLLLHQLGCSTSDIGELPSHFGAQVLIDLQDLKLDLADFSARLCNGGNQLSALAPEPFSLSLETAQPSVGNEIFLPELTDTRELLADPFDLTNLRSKLRVQAGNFLAELGDALLELGPLSFAPPAPGFELPQLAGDRPCDICIVRSVQQITRENDHIVAVAFGLQARLTGCQFVECLRNYRKVGTCLDIIKSNQNIPGSDLTSVARGAHRPRRRWGVAPS